MILAKPSDGARFLLNCYISAGINGNTEIDLIMLYMSGVYVIEPPKGNCG
jgi:hypothetical protein